MWRVRRAFGAIAGVPALVFPVATAHAQQYPSKPLRIVTSEPGGVADLTARLIAQGLSRGLHQPAIVDNRGGASGVIGIDIVARAPADGYTLIVFSPSLWTLPLIQRTSYDTLRDFAPVTLAVTAPNLLLVHPSFPAVSVQALIALARANPGAYNYAAGSTGAANHLSGELFKSMAGVDIVRVPFRGTGPGLNALLGGQVQMMFAGAGSAVPLVQSGRLRALAVTSAQPSALFPELPTIAASGLPGYELETNTGMFAPIATPAAIIDRLQTEIARALHAPEVRQKLAGAGMEPVANTPAKFTAKIRAEIARLGKVVKEAGIRAD
jgi:tripartite-type tricarboxylate transporter receptor subunit TctC